ncbi:hypothetical protein C2W27_14485 [Salmonella enterica]|nr:hypothetical protein [Salmonella enterica]
MRKRLTEERLLELGRFLARHVAQELMLDNILNGRKVDPMFADCLVALAELKECRVNEAVSVEPVSFDALNAAVAEVTGCNQHAWDANLYKGHHVVPFINYNSLLRIVEMFRLRDEPVAVLYRTGEVLTREQCGMNFDICCKVETPLYAARKVWRNSDDA